jgi:hypothetical protein
MKNTLQRWARRAKEAETKLQKNIEEREGRVDEIRGELKRRRWFSRSEVLHDVRK